MIQINSPIVKVAGEYVAWTHYPSLESPTYDATTEVPDYGTPVVSSIKAIMKDPTLWEREHSGGKITDNTKKFILESDIAISNGDLITYDSVDYLIEITNKMLTRTVCFGNKK